MVITFCLFSQDVCEDMPCGMHPFFSLFSAIDKIIIEKVHKIFQEGKIKQK